MGQTNSGPSWRSSRHKPPNTDKAGLTETELFSVLRGFCVVIEDIAEYSHIQGDDHQDLLYVANRVRETLNVLEVRVGAICERQDAKKQK
jgi:hypothetical protein